MACVQGAAMEAEGGWGRHQRRDRKARGWLVCLLGGRCVASLPLHSPLLRRLTGPSPPRDLWCCKGSLRLRGVPVRTAAAHGQEGVGARSLRSPLPLTLEGQLGLFLGVFMVTVSEPHCTGESRLPLGSSAMPDEQRVADALSVASMGGDPLGPAAAVSPAPEQARSPLVCFWVPRPHPVGVSADVAIRRRQG